MLALAGCHGSGKSTLASAYADKHGISPVFSRAGEVFKSFGFTVGQPMTSDQRLDIQDAILDAWVADIKLADGLWISDRSPIDSAAYVIADLAAMPDLDHKRALAYVERCFWEANRYCPIIVLVQPGIPLVARDNRPAPNPVTQERMNAVLWGLLGDNRLNTRTAFIGRHNTGLADRLDAVEHVLEHVVTASMKELKYASLQ